MSQRDIPPFDSAYADRQLALRLAKARYKNAPDNSIEKANAWIAYRDLLKQTQDAGEHR